MYIPPGKSHARQLWTLSLDSFYVRHDRKRRLFRQLTNVVHTSLGYSRWGSSDSIPYTLFLNEGVEPEFLFLSVIAEKLWKVTLNPIQIK